MAAVRLHEFCAGNPDVMAWLREHDLDPNDVAMAPSPVIDGDRMTVHLFLKDDGGHRYIDPDTGSAATEARTVTLLRPPPNLHFTDGTPFPATVAA